MFSITGLDPAAFAPLFLSSDADLAARDARRVIADGPGFPCRVSLIDAAPGDELVLCAFTHHDVASPYRGAGAIFVRRAATEAARFVDEVPASIARRLVSVRAYRADGEMLDAEVMEGATLATEIARWFADPAIAYLHVHNARPGCFAARVERHAEG